jgi:DNA-binding IclR family transcriptional regulator
MPHEEEAIDGDEDRGPAIQSIARAAAVLRALEAGGSDGRTLTAVARDTGFAKGTTHRLLQALTEIGFVYQDLGTRCYRLGAALGLLSRHAFQQDIASLARPALQRLAAASGDTISLSVPEGRSSVCIDRELGAFPIRNLSLDVGQLRPLGVGSGSLALLAFMPADEIEVIIARNAVWLHDYPAYHPDALRKMVRQTQSQGFSYVDGLIIPGVNAVGVPIFDADRRPTAALSITAIAVRISGDRTVEMVNLLNTEARRLSEQLVTAGGRISD